MENNRAFRRGDYVRLSGMSYGSYDGEIGRLYGELNPVKGQPVWTVDVGGMAIQALESDLERVEKPKSQHIRRWRA